MKHLTLIIITLFVFQMNHAQNNNYSKLWKQVETFENEGLPKSALKIVEDLETLAKKENQDKQLIKTLLFKSKYALILEEDAQLQVVLDFKKAISNSPRPKKMCYKICWLLYIGNTFNITVGSFITAPKPRKKLMTKILELGI